MHAAKQGTVEQLTEAPPPPPTTPPPPPLTLGYTTNRAALRVPPHRSPAPPPSVRALPTTQCRPQGQAIDLRVIRLPHCRSVGEDGAATCWAGTGKLCTCIVALVLTCSSCLPRALNNCQFVN
ncbi:hypothetical protein E2C01_016735 [Portunus trituberculatus]|uniref:Uncharacterized protein n=1 Tax=Portunus trituberculatus TaxID=210409 RepID=A0A5B7DRZ1_PORTR|nr:hypothetical protein [Portunus trituberculatus]